MGRRTAAEEMMFFLLLAVALSSLPIILFHGYPVAYAHLISEDFEGEYGTAVAYVGASLLFLLDARRAPLRSRKVISLIIGMVALLIAGEELSWGQRVWTRLFGFQVPETIQALNVQKEINLHNLEVVGLSGRTYTAGSYLMLGWLVVSALLLRVRPGLGARAIAAGIPLVPLRLAPVCLLPPTFFLLYPVAKADEIGELLLALAALLFAIDYCQLPGRLGGAWRPSRPQAAAVGLIAVGLLTSALTAASPLGHMGWRLHTLAKRDYQGFGMYQQADQIFDYIERHPTELQRWHTRLDHAEMLIAAGKMAEARTVAATAVAELDADPAALDSERRCRVGRLYAALGQAKDAEVAFAAAIAADRDALPELEAAGLPAAPDRQPLAASSPPACAQ